MRQGLRRQEFESAASFGCGEWVVIFGVGCRLLESGPQKGRVPEYSDTRNCAGGSRELLTPGTSRSNSGRSLARVHLNSDVPHLKTVLENDSNSTRVLQLIAYL
eukprot:3813201-Rhodomonas_salina.1